eukprot:1766206-Prymnesium_polylepis.1
MKQQGRSAENIVLIPFVFPMLIGRRMTSKPAVVVSASVRTAEIAPTGISQHVSTETVEVTMVANMVCAAGM